jgi:hypothetical protein
MIRSGLIILGSVLAHAALGSSIDITLQCRSDKCNLKSAAILLRSASDHGTLHRVFVTTPAVHLVEQPGTEWDVGLDAPGLWSQPQHVVFPAADANVKYSMLVWRVGMLHGHLRLPDPQPTTPPTVKVMVTSRPEPRVTPDIPRGTTFTCSSDNTAGWQCTVPATMLDIAVRVEGYVPYHRWDVRIPADSAVDLGTVKLQKGGSLVAWLDGAFVKQVTVPVSAILRYDAMPGPSAVAARLALPVAEGTFTKKGVVQLAPIAPGHYVLDVVAQGYAPARIPVELYDGRETTPRQSIELSPSLSVRLHLDPPVGPGTVPWRIELWRSTTFGSGSQSAGSGTASPNGVFEAGDQSEGKLRVQVKDGKQNIVANRDILISATTSDYTIHLDVAAVNGKVSIGDTALSGAQLLFGGSGGGEKIRATTDTNGYYTATLPRAGKWVVDVAAPADAVAATTDVIVEKNPADIVLPSTEIAGWVRDANGNRLAAARVMLFANDRPMTQATSADGSFRFRGMQPGLVRLQASDPRTHDYSRFVDLSVPESGSLNNVQLDLEAVRTLKGVVRSADDVVVGALVHGYAFLGTSAQQAQATTDLQGRFSFDVPGSASEAIVVIAAPGRALEAFSIPTNQDEMTLELAPRGGTLNLHWRAADVPLRFAFNEHLVPAVELFAWARAQGASIDNGQGAIPNVAPGKYRFCSSTHCAEGLLAIGSQLDLDATR